MAGALPERIAARREAIYRFVLAIVREPAAAEDLTQETLLRAHAKLATLEDPARIDGWLYRIAANLCRDRFRGADYRNRPRSLEAQERGEGGRALADTLTDDAPRLDKALEQREMSACVQQYLDALPDSYRAAILLHDVEGLTNPEIAAMLGVSVGTVKIRLHRARRKLRAALDRACSFSTDERGVYVCEPRPNTSDT